MKKLALVAMVLCVGSLGLTGCGGDKKDETPAPAGDKMAPAGDKMAPAGDKMAPAGDKMAPAGDKMAPAGDKMAPAGDKMAPAGGVKDKVEAALKADDKTKAETITVEEKAGKVMLKGEVADNTIKKAAGEAANKALTDAKSTDKLINALTVKKH